VGRIGAMDTWVGYAPTLENEILPQVENIVEEAHLILGY
jgi:pyruvate/2-oxoglutarate/acetoin dehydrogenase E1 component